jgi:hypothetical protein
MRALISHVQDRPAGLEIETSIESRHDKRANARGFADRMAPRQALACRMAVKFRSLRASGIHSGV